MTEPKVTEKSKEEFKKEEEVLDNIKVIKLSKALSNVINLDERYSAVDPNPWTAEEVDKLAVEDVIKEYRSVVDSCRFYFRRDPIASTVINKIVDISITRIKLIQGSIPINQYRVYESLLPEMQLYAETCALEYLISGLLLPEVDFVTMNKKELKRRKIKTYNSLSLPDAMWVRDPSTVVINSPIISGKPSYYVEIPPEFVYFIKNEGKYPDGTEDKELYQELLKLYPDFVKAVKKGDTKLFPLEPTLALRRRFLSDSPYPTPYLYPALESLKHKRNIKRMDYSIAARALSAIMQISVGSDEFPVVAEDDMQLEALQQQMRWRNSSSSKDIEKIFQLFTNHTVEIKWVYPDMTSLLDDGKYTSVNEDILFALGLPRILLTGETAKSQTSNSDTAMLSPEKTMDNLRRVIERILDEIVFEVAEENKFANVPDVELMPMNLRSFKEFVEGLMELYDKGNLSRESLARVFGFDFEEEVKLKAEEKKLLKKFKVEEFAPVPHSNTPETTETKKPTTETKKSSKRTARKKKTAPKKAK